MSGRVFSRAAASPPVAVRAEGSTIWDANGRSYLDAAGGAIVVSVGHGRRSVAEAMAAQAGTLAYAHGSVFTSEPDRIVAPPFVESRLSNALTRAPSSSKLNGLTR